MAVKYLSDQLVDRGCHVKFLGVRDDASEVEFTVWNVEKESDGFGHFSVAWVDDLSDDDSDEFSYDLSNAVYDWYTAN